MNTVGWRTTIAEVSTLLIGEHPLPEPRFTRAVTQPQRKSQIASNVPRPIEVSQGLIPIREVKAIEVRTGRSQVGQLDMRMQ